MAAIAACCLIDVGAAWVFRIWHPSPFGWGGDFYTESLIPLRSLAHGHLLTFLQRGPSYLGSAFLEAPFALPAIWLKAPGATIFFLAALPSILVAPLLVWRSVARRGTGRLRWADLPLALIVLNPVTLTCLDFGHPEDILTACLMIGAVIEASQGSSRTAGVLIALAIIAKPWGVIGAPIVWSASSDPRQTCVESIVWASAFWLPVIMIRELAFGGGGTSVSLGTEVGNIDAPQQLFYGLGSNSWISQHAHLLIPLAAVVLAALWHRRHRADAASDRITDALWLLALVLLIRAAFDPWDNPYYHLPFLMAVMAAEARSRRGLPLLTILATVVAFIVVPPHAAATGDPAADARLYAAAAVPALILLAVRSFGRPRWFSVSRAMRRSAPGTQKSGQSDNLCAPAQALETPFMVERNTNLPIQAKP